MDSRRFSVVIPAHNEALRTGRCLEAIAAAAERYPGQVETIVVLNRCTDSTGAIAAARGARTVLDDHRNLAATRNAGAHAASGEIIVTIDADSVMPSNALVEVDRALSSGRYIGGGVPIWPERMSCGIFLTALALSVYLVPLRISAGMFWCYRRDFEAIGGFNERCASAEDVDFAIRLKAHGRTLGKRYGTLYRVKLRTSCRKFDQFGDWFMLRMLVRNPRQIWRALHGTDPELANRYWYDYEEKAEG